MLVFGAVMVLGTALATGVLRLRGAHVTSETTLPNRHGDDVLKDGR